MRAYLSIIIFFFPSIVMGQNNSTFSSEKERLYEEIVSAYGDEIRVIRDMGFEQMEFWNKVDSLFGNMPLDTAISYYQDTNYCIKYYSFLKVLGQNDSIAFELLKNHIADSTQVMYEISDFGNFKSFNEILSRAYESFIDSKYYWCDSNTNSNYYFRKEKFDFKKYNYAKWPSILTGFLELIKPWNIHHYHKLEELKDYRGVNYFYGR